VIKYLGSKRRLVPVLGEMFTASGARDALDLFTGTTRVAQEFKRRGGVVTTVDTARYSEVFARCYIETDAAAVDLDALTAALERLDALGGVAGYFTETFCSSSRYLRPENGARVDAIRAAIAADYHDSPLFPILLTSLIEAADRVDSTVGLQMAYLKSWAPRAANRLELREPVAVEGPAGRVLCHDANELGDELAGIDLAYLDPPYNQHSYYANYHVWETIVRNDTPPHYGVACKREDVRQTKSAYNSRRTAWPALAGLIERLPTPWIVVSLSNEGFHDLAAVQGLLAERGHVGRLDVDSRRYVGAKIGIHNSAGRRVGSVSHLRNTEVVFVCGPDRDLVERVTRRQADVAHAI
jgi:adenine-specific DNA-methyltransferase